MNDVRERFLAAANTLVGKQCWGTCCGRLHHIALGRKFPLKRKRANPNLSRDMRDYEPEYMIWLRSNWRLDGSDSTICSSQDDAATGSTMSMGMSRLIGETVTSISIRPPAYDLTVSFGSSLTLRLFCEGSIFSQDLPCYQLFLPEAIFTVSNGGRIEVDFHDPGWPSGS